MTKKIKIAGAGPAGLSAAINLAKAGYKAVVYEQNSDVGFKSNGDFQGLENWTKDLDILKDFKRMNIKPTFKHTPMKKFEFYDHKSRCYRMKSKKQIFYLVRRGNSKDCFDYSLKKQALASGAKIIFSKRITEKQADIVATGAHKHIAFAEGITFDTNLPNQIMSIADNKLSPNFYAYMIAVDKKACILTCMEAGTRNPQLFLKKTIKRFQTIKKFDIKNRKAVGCGTDYLISDTATKNSRLYAGEAAGFQDALFGFGIRYAVTSGYLAAQSIIQKKDYDTLWKEEFGALLKQGISNRLRYELAGKSNYISVLKQAATGDIADYFAKWYRPDITKALLYPFAKALCKDRKIFK